MLAESAAASQLYMAFDSIIQLSWLDLTSLALKLAIFASANYESIDTCRISLAMC